jgi:hypothetical protein
MRSALSLRSLDLVLSSILAILFLASLAGCHEPLCCLSVTAAWWCLQPGRRHHRRRRLPVVLLRFFSFSPPLSLSGLHLRTDPLTFVDRLGGSSAALVVEMTLYAIVLLAHCIVTVQLVPSRAHLSNPSTSFRRSLAAAPCLVLVQDSAVHLPANWISAPALARPFVVLGG